MSLTEFETDTAVTPRGAGVWSAHCSREWFSPRGPHGGYLAAIVARALTAAVDDPSRAARSLTLHYLRPPSEGELEVEVRVERSGRSLTSLTTRLSQDGKLCVVGIAAFSASFPSVVDYAPHAPQVTPPAEIAVTPRQADGIASMAQRFAMRPLPYEELPRRKGDVVSGGWMALHEPPPVDAALLALLTDAWIPIPFMRLTTWAAAPTVDLTIHLRVADPAAHVARDEPVLGVFTSRLSADGFFDEEGELWSPGGVLLAQSRQLGLLIAA